MITNCRCCRQIAIPTVVLVLAACSLNQAGLEYKPDTVVERKLAAIKAGLSAPVQPDSPGPTSSAASTSGVAASPAIHQIRRAGKKAALIVGNASYSYAPLRNPINDAKAIGRKLTDLGFEARVVLDANFERMEDEIANFSQRIAKGYNVTLFYYAGHGVQIEGENYLIPVGERINNERDARYRSVSLNKVLDSLGGYSDRLNIAVFDACRDNPLPRGTRALSRGLAQATGPKGTIIAYSTSPGSVASDGEGQYSIFAKYFLGSMDERGLPVESFFKKVLKGVYAETRGSQVPWLSSSYMGDFSFNQ